MRRTLLIVLVTIYLAPAVQAQYELPDSTALEAIIVERYYISDASDATDTDGGNLTAGSVTYRVFVDMKPGYELQAVYGNANNLLEIATTTEFFNNEDRGEISGDVIDATRIDENTVALDSWITMGAASDGHWGVLKSDDVDGGVIAGVMNDGGSEAVAGGLLVNADPDAGIPLTEQDGLLAGVVPSVTIVGLNTSMLADANSANVLSTSSGAWSVLEGVQGPTAENRVLVAQITTNGILTFRLNVQLGIPEELQCGHPDCHSTIQFVAVLHPEDAVAGVSTDNIFQNDGLLFDSGEVNSIVEQSGPTLRYLVYPNPSSGELFVRSATVGMPGAPTSIAVFDLAGRPVIHEELGVRTLGDPHRIDVQALPSGCYLLQVTQGSTVESIPFLHQ